MSRLLKLYRGISLTYEELVSHRVGNFTEILRFSSSRSPIISRVVSDFDELLASGSIEDVFPPSEQVPFVFATADINTAAFYAHRSKGNNKIPLVVEFEVPMDQVYIDGRDFMINMLQSIDRGSEIALNLKTESLIALYGENVRYYINKCLETSDTLERIKIGNLACFDRSLVEHHLKNNILIEGRFNTYFKSAINAQPPFTVINIIENPILNFSQVPEISFPLLQQS